MWYENHRESFLAFPGHILRLVLRGQVQTPAGSIAHSGVPSTMCRVAVPGFCMKIQTFRVNIDWLQGYVAFSCDMQSSAFSEMVPGREPLPVQRHTVKAYLIMHGVLLFWGAGLAWPWIVGHWTTERKKEKEKKREAFIEDPHVHLQYQPWKPMCPLLLCLLLSTFLSCWQVISDTNNSWVTGTSQ